jgi:GTP-binding protein
MAKTIAAKRASDSPGAAMSAFQQIQYLASAAEPHQMPPDRGAEVAFVGRSNAGKSSAINAICGRRKLAFVSRTPGRTQMINFFSLGQENCLVDLPGYGYAKVPAEIRDRWENLLGTYLHGRVSLRGLVIVVDARHGLAPLDGQMLRWFATTGKSVHVLLTKADKLGRQQQKQQKNHVHHELAQVVPAASVQLFSSVTGDGVEEAREMVLGWLASPR